MNGSLASGWGVRRLADRGRGDAAKPLALIAAAALAAGACLRFGGADGVVASIVMTASLLSSVAGFAFSALSGATLFHASGDEPVRLVQIMMTCSIANQAAMTWEVRRSIRWPSLARALAGGFLGLPLGVGLLLHADRRSYLVALGIFLTAYGLVTLVRRPVVLRASPIVDALAGFAGGVTGAVAAFPSAFLTIWVGMQGLTKAEQRGTFQPFILVMQLAALGALALARGGGPAGGYDWRLLIFAPAALAGTAVGVRIYRGMSERHFRLAVTGLLIASGLSYLV